MGGRDMWSGELRRLRNGRYDGYRSSEEVLAAIEEVAGEELPTEGEEGEAYRIWDYPTPEEATAVEALAWEIAYADEDMLHWGMQALRRPGSAPSL